ncbi:MAG: gamma-glutamyltransferase [Planctomycetota bacterium]|nr:gamma-glutamyltransferase [Planctomycetota bacterium]
MNRSIRSSVKGLLLLTYCVSATGQTNHATNSRGMVATVNPTATRAAVSTLEGGGNAVDAAVTAALTLAVVDGYNSGIGGGCFILIRTPAGAVYAIDGREVAPKSATQDMFLADGKPIPEASRIGPLASGVPGALAAYEKAWRLAGRADWSLLFERPIQVAEEGFVIPGNFAQRIRAKAKWLARYEGSRDVLFDDAGLPRGEGTTLIQSDLANTLKGIRDHGIKYFYRGPTAMRVSDWMTKNGGLLTARDFRNYRVRMREPVKSSYRGYSIVGFPPPSSGGVHVAQMLNILEHYDLSHLYSNNRAQYIHIITESMKLAFADRAYWLGDPGFTRVPRGLISADYAEQLSNRIDVTRASEVRSHGRPPDPNAKVFNRHTTHIAVADAEGYWVAITATVNTSFGSTVIVPGTGVILNNEMDDFAIAPGIPNAFGLVGSDANAVASLKRPLSSMSPTIILKDGNPVMTVGAAGGPRIITNALLGTIRVLDLEMTPVEALAAKRFHHQWSPDRLYMEQGTDPELVQSLRAMGHRVTVGGSAGTTQLIHRDPATGLFTGVHDPRVPGKAAGPDR